MPLTTAMLDQFERELYRAKREEILREAITLCICFGKPTDSLEKDLKKGLNANA